MFRTALAVVIIAASAALVAKTKDKICKKDCTIKGVDFRSEKWKETKFDNQNFEKVIFSESNLTGLEFTKVRLKNVKFLNSNMNFVIFNNAEINSTVFENIQADNYLSLKSSRIFQTRFTSLKSEDINFNETTITSCTFDGITWDKTKSLTFSDSKIIDSDFRDEKFTSRVSFNDTLVSKSDFTNSRFLSYVNTAGLKIEESRFDNAYFSQGWILDVRGSSFSGLVMEDGDGGYMKCHSSNFSGAIIKTKGFRISSADNCDFSNADLSAIEKINFNAVKNSNFCNAKLPDGTLGKCGA